MSGLGWRIAPIFILTIKQFVGGKAVRAVFGLSMIPVLFALVYRLNPDVGRPRRQFDGALLDILLPTIMPLAVLVLATATFGDEIEDRTLPYLVLKPISRLRIVIEKALAAITVSAPIVGFGVLLTWVLIFAGDAGDNTDILIAAMAAVVVGVTIYTCVFQMLSLLIRRAILASILYSLVWESVLGRFIPGLRYLSIRQVVTSVYTSVLDDRRLGTNNAFGTGSALFGAAVVCVIMIALSTWRLRQINIE
ncbi:MAG TPA: ABC transporter permease subunit [Thermomicrobiales bacterium]|nr:ABC transporter permease subunit [Thermomicrobiales bacterium]